MRLRDDSNLMSIRKTETPVVILGAVAHDGLGIARSLGRLGVPVYAISANRFAPVFFSRYCRGQFLWDIDTAPIQDTVFYLAALSRKLDPHRPILIPTSDDAAIFVADNRGALAAWFKFPNQSCELVHSLCSKRQMYYLAKGFNVSTAETIFPESSADVAEFAKHAVFPVVLKGVDGTRLFKRTGNKMYIVWQKTELLELYSSVEEPQSPNLMIQEYIPSGDDTVWMFNGYFNESSDCLVGFTGKKIRQCPAYRGCTSLGICLKNEIVQKITTGFMKAIGYRGVLDIGFKYDARDNTYKVLDINPRIGATFRLFVADNGMDVARAFYLDMTGQEIQSADTPEGRKWIVEDMDVASCFRYYRDRKLRPTDWLRSLHGIEEMAYLAPDDPLPLFPRLAADFSRLPGRLAKYIVQPTFRSGRPPFRYTRESGKSML
jgi:D-aspartate ligase